MNKIKQIASEFIRKNKLTVVDYAALKKVAAKMGYTIIEYNSISNEENVECVINNLSLNDNAAKSRGFTYTSKDYRLIFVNEDLNDEEKLIVLSHELGHILCEHISSAPIIGQDVKEEYEANEFSHYLLYQNAFAKIKRFLCIHRKKFIAGIAVLCLLAGSVAAYVIINRADKYMDDLYITSTGEHYHKKECIFIKNKNNTKRMTKEEFDTGLYNPCDMCLPDID